MERRSLLIKAVIGTLAIFGISKKGMSTPLKNSDKDSDLLKNKNADIITELALCDDVSIVEQCQSIEKLRKTLPLKPMQKIHVRGYYEDSLEGGGDFYFDDRDLSSADDGGIVIVSSGKRWKRVDVAHIKPQYFGARGDGITDDTKAVQQSLDAAVNNTLYLGSKLYRTSNLSINGPLVIQGAGRRIKAGLVPLDYTAGKFISINCAQSPTFHDVTISARNVKADDELVGIYIARYGDGKTYTPSIIMYNCNVNSFPSGCIYSEPGRHMGVLENCQMEYSIEDCVTINGVDWNISHCNIGYTKVGNGIVITQPTNRIANSDIYFNKKNGILLSNNAINGYISSNVINSNGLNGISIISDVNLKQGHVIAGNFFFNNSRLESGVYSNVFLAEGIQGVSVTGNSHFTYSNKSQRPRYLLELGNGASASIVGDSYNENSYTDSPINNNKTSIIGDKTTAIGSTSSLIKYISQESRHAFLVQDEEAKKDIFTITSSGELVFGDADGKKIFFGIDDKEANTLRVAGSLSIGNSSEYEKLSCLKLGSFYLWDDNNGNLRIDVREPVDIESGSVLFKL